MRGGAVPSGAPREKDRDGLMRRQAYAGHGREGLHICQGLVESLVNGRCAYGVLDGLRCDGRVIGVLVTLVSVPR